MAAMWRGLSAVRLSGCRRWGMDKAGSGEFRDGRRCDGALRSGRWWSKERARGGTRLLYGGINGGRRQLGDAGLAIEAHLPHYGATVGEVEEERRFEEQACTQLFEEASSYAAGRATWRAGPYLLLRISTNVANRHPDWAKDDGRERSEAFSDSPRVRVEFSPDTANVKLKGFY